MKENQYRMSLLLSIGLRQYVLSRDIHYIHYSQVTDALAVVMSNNICDQNITLSFYVYLTTNKSVKHHAMILYISRYTISNMTKAFEFRRNMNYHQLPKYKSYHEKVNYNTVKCIRSLIKIIAVTLYCVHALSRISDSNTQTQS